MALGDKERQTAGEREPLTPADDQAKTGHNKPVSRYSPDHDRYKVWLLDGTEMEVAVTTSAKGQELFEKVCENLGLEERDYFCISYRDGDIRFWLHPDKSVRSQLNKRMKPLYFEVKFYPKQPNTDLHHEDTRYLLFLQVRLDILKGKVPVSFVTHQLLGSYAVQSDLGDYDVDEHEVGIAYIKDMQFAPYQSDELLEKIAKLHMLHRGQSAPDAEKNYLDNAKLLAFYGVDFHHATARNTQDAQFEVTVGSPVTIGVSADGVAVFKDTLAIFRWPWQKIISFSYDRSGFSIKIRPATLREKAQTYKYKMTYNLAKRLWQSTVEHHAFFRLSKPLEPERAKFPKFGSKYRYPGRTQHQVAGAPDTDRPAPIIRRGAGTRFLARGPTDTVDTTASGYSTDRAEKYYTADQPSTSNTLTLPDRRKQPTYTGQDGDGSTSPVPMAGFDEDDSRVALLSGSMVGYSKAHPDQHNISSYTSPQADNATMETTTTTTTTTKQTTVNVVMTTNRNVEKDEEEEMLPPYQDDQTALLRPKGQAVVAMSPTGLAQTGWGASRESKTSSRTYTDTDGNVITEYTLEREGVVEKHIEKRTIVEEEGDDTDYDKALMEAIKKVTDMNQDLSVEKIEIQTTADRV